MILEKIYSILSEQRPDRLRKDSLELKKIYIIIRSDLLSPVCWFTSLNPTESPDIRNVTEISF